MARVREDTEPWYRQFWPWFIIALPAAAVVGGLTTVWISLQTTDSLVVQSDEGIQIVADRRAQAERLAAELELTASIDIDTASGSILAVLHTGELQTAPAALQLNLSHPAFAERDRHIVLNRAPPDKAGHPAWSGHFVSTPAGRWYVTLTSNGDWRLSGEWRGESQITLRPAAAGNAAER